MTLITNDLYEILSYRFTCSLYIATIIIFIHVTDLISTAAIVTNAIGLLHQGLETLVSIVTV